MNDALTPALSGIYILTSDGELGHCDSGGGFVADAGLSQAFAGYNRQLLQAYLDRPHETGIRLGIVYQPHGHRPWGAETLAMETAVLKHLYGVCGRWSEGLTEFQKRNREKSVYRGMELFLEYRDDHFPNAVIYAPVLFDRHTTLDQYTGLLDRAPQADDARTPVVEVINLLAGITIPKRNSPYVHLLASTLHRSIVRKDVRKAVSFDVLDRVEIDNPRPVFDDVIHHAPGPVLALPTVGAKSPARTDATHPLRRCAQNTGKRAKPGMLRAFTQFRHLPEDKLSLLVRTNPVYRAPGGKMLLTRGAMDRGNFYLLQGKIELHAADGERQVIDGGTSKAAAPISFLKPRKYDVFALTPVTFLWIHDTLLDAIINGNLTRRGAIGTPAPPLRIRRLPPDGGALPIWPRSPTPPAHGGQPHQQPRNLVRRLTDAQQALDGARRLVTPGGVAP